MPPITKTTDPGPAEERPGQYASPDSDPAETTSHAPLYGAGDRAATARQDQATAPTDTIPATRASEPAPAPVGLVAAGDRCANCGVPMAADQHYCLNCGERRGPARFTATPANTGTTGGARFDPPPRGSRFSAGTTLIAGVATLLLALGIGVVIGNQSASSPAPTNSKAQVVYLNGAGGGAGAANTGAAPTTAPVSSGGSSGSANKSSGKSNNKSAAKANTSASSSTAAATSSATTAQQLPPATVTVGAKGHGAGYQHGKFTGNFFGP